jgi:hypothetical protein
VVLLLVGLALWIAPDGIAQLVWDTPLNYIPHYAITVEDTPALGNQLVGGAAVLGVEGRGDGDHYVLYAEWGKEVTICR